jgi:hypothetical protein
MDIEVGPDIWHRVENCFYSYETLVLLDYEFCAERMVLTDRRRGHFHHYPPV